MKRKVLIFMLITAMALSFTACGGGNKDTPDEADKDQITNEIGKEDQIDQDKDNENTDNQKPAVDKPSTEKPSQPKPPASKPAPSKPAPSKPAPSKPAPGGNSVLSGTLEEIMGKVYEGLKDLPKTAITEVTAENMEYYLGVNDIKFKRAIASEPMMSSVAHSIVLIEVEKGADISAIKSAIKKNVDGRKWICVGVEDENILVDNIGNHIILVMDEKSDEFMNNFLALKGK